MATPVSVLIDPDELDRARAIADSHSGPNAAAEGLRVLLAALKEQAS